jgi:SAM-dependent methyltransferase
MKSVDRFDFILKYVKYKNILDIGSCQFGKKRELIKNSCKSYTGLDIELCDDKDVLQGDAQNFYINKKFDIILAGEVIEHLSNFTGFFMSCKKHLVKGGVLLITTPNPYSFSAIFSKLRHEEVNNTVKHTVLFDGFVFKSMAKMNGFIVEEKIFYNMDNPQTLSLKFGKFIGKLLPKYAYGYIFILKDN